jgi:hypothetical protein
VFEFVRDAMASLALVLGTQALATTLVLLGATAFAAAALVLVSRSVTVLAMVLAPARVCPTRGAVEVAPLVPQRDPDASGHVRPRAPGIVLG